MALLKRVKICYKISTGLDFHPGPSRSVSFKRVPIFLVRLVWNTMHFNIRLVFGASGHVSIFGFHVMLDEDFQGPAERILQYYQLS